MPCCLAFFLPVRCDVRSECTANLILMRKQAPCLLAFENELVLQPCLDGICVFLVESCYAFLILIDGCKPENISQLEQVCFLSTARMFQDTLVKRSLDFCHFQILTFLLLIAPANCRVSLCLRMKRA